MDGDMVMPVGDLLPELVLLAGGVLVLLYALFTPRRAQVHAASFAVLVLAATGAASVATVGGRQRLTFFDTYAVDGAAFWGKLIILGVTLITVLLSVDWFREDARQGEYYPILLFSALGAILLAGATDLMELILAVLLASATGYVLAAYHRHSKASAEAAIKYYLLGAITNGAMLYGAALLFGVAATTTFPGLRTGLANAQGWLVAVGFALVFLGVAFKMGAVPTHAWMPDVAEGAPAPAAAFLTVAAKVGALIVLARLVRVLPEAAVGWRPLIALVAAATMTLGNLAALWQDDVRRLLGWSSVSQTGYGLMAIVALDRSELALPALLFFLVAYALGNLAAFGVVIALRGLTDRRAFAGLARTRPLLAFALTLAFLSLVGVPPLAGFTAKLMLFAATIDAGYTWLAVVAIVNSVVSLAYYARVLGPAYFDTPAARPARLGPWAMLATGVCAAGLIIVGLGAQFFMDAFASIRLLP